MTKFPPLVVAATLVGAMAANAFMPMAYAEETPGSATTGTSAEKPAAKPASPTGATNSMRVRATRGLRGAGPLLAMTCSSTAPERLEKLLDRLSKRLDLTDTQTPLFEDWKTAALVGASSYVDACVTPPRDGAADPIAAFKTRETNMQAGLDAMKPMLPPLEAFYNSLTDEQKKILKPLRHGLADRIGHNRRGRGWERHDRRDNNHCRDTAPDDTRS